MYGYSNQIGCVSVEAVCFNEDIEFSFFAIGEKVNFESFRLTEGVNVSGLTLTGKTCLKMFMLTEQPIITAYLICTINKESYLKVNPDYVWLTPDMLSSGEFDIISNVNWNIV
jgi:hypothetical protein